MVAATITIITITITTKLSYHKDWEIGLKRKDGLSKCEKYKLWCPIKMIISNLIGPHLNSVISELTFVLQQTPSPH